MFFFLLNVFLAYTIRILAHPGPICVFFCLLHVHGLKLKRIIKKYRWSFLFNTQLTYLQLIFHKFWFFFVADSFISLTRFKSLAHIIRELMTRYFCEHTCFHLIFIYCFCCFILNRGWKSILHGKKNCVLLDFVLMGFLA